MKKLFILLLSTCIFGFTLTGCGSNKTETPEGTDNNISSTESVNNEQTVNNGETAQEDTTETEVGTELSIYLVRHGKTFFNTTGQVQGFADSPLTDVGIEQAIKVGAGMKEIPFITAYCGELGRQRKTAQLILEQSGNQIPVLTENVGFNEWNYGGYEGKTNAEMWDPVFEQHGLKFDEDWSQYEELHNKLGDKGIADAIAANDEVGAAETYDDILTRAKAAMDTLVEQSLAAGGGNVLVVSSGSQIPTILEMFVPEDYNGEAISNCSVSILKYKDGVYSLESLNDTSYLDAQ